MPDPRDTSTRYGSPWRRSVDSQKANLDLKRVVSKNIEKTVSTAKKERPDLIDNFHWVIMRFRRQRKLTQEQFADAISEPVSAIMMAEQGVMPENDYILVRKIENFLGISLIKDEAKKLTGSASPAPKVLPKVLKIDSNDAKELTIADLRRIKERREFDAPEDFEEVSEKEKEVEDEAGRD